MQQSPLRRGLQFACVGQVVTQSGYTHIGDANRLHAHPYQERAEPEWVVIKEAYFD